MGAIFAAYLPAYFCSERHCPFKKENPGINNGNKSRPLIDRQRETIWKWKITRDTLGETERKRIWSAKVKVA